MKVQQELQQSKTGCAARARSLVSFLLLFLVRFVQGGSLAFLRPGYTDLHSLLTPVIKILLHNSVYIPSNPIEPPRQVLRADPYQ